MYHAIAAAFYLGAYLVDKKMYGLNFEKIMVVFSCIIFGANGVSHSASYIPDYAKAKIVFENLCDLFDSKPTINNWECESKKEINAVEFDGNISIDSIGFRYPNRPNAQVLQDFSINIQKGQRIALVGSSGCGMFS